MLSYKYKLKLIDNKIKSLECEYLIRWKNNLLLIKQILNL